MSRGFAVMFPRRFLGKHAALLCARRGFDFFVVAIKLFISPRKAWKNANCRNHFKSAVCLASLIFCVYVCITPVSSSLWILRTKHGQKLATGFLWGGLFLPFFCHEKKTKNGMAINKWNTYFCSHGMPALTVPTVRLWWEDICHCKQFLWNCAYGKWLDLRSKTLGSLSRLFRSSLYVS